MKTLTSAMDNLLRGQMVRAAILAELALPAGTDRVWSGLGTLTWNGNSFFGLGKMGKIVGAGETAEIRTTNTSYQLSGNLDADGVNKYISTVVRNGIAKAWIAFLDDAEQVIPDPILIDQTILDTVSVTYAATGEASLMLNGTSAVFDFRLPRELFLTNEQLQADYPGDTGFDRIPGLANKVISWTKT